MLLLVWSCTDSCFRQVPEHSVITFKLKTAVLILWRCFYHASDIPRWHWWPVNGGVRLIWRDAESCDATGTSGSVEESSFENGMLLTAVSSGGRCPGVKAFWNVWTCLGRPIHDFTYKHCNAMGTKASLMDLKLWNSSKWPCMRPRALP